MSLHVFANVVTPFGTAANNRAENEGNITTLQKLLWQGETHSTVSAEAIRFALRRVLGESETTNRAWDEVARANVWEDHQFKGWTKDKGVTFVDDDLLGFIAVGVVGVSTNRWLCADRPNTAQGGRLPNANALNDPFSFSPCVVATDQGRGANHCPHNRGHHHLSIDQDRDRLTDMGRRGLPHLRGSCRIELHGDAEKCGHVFLDHTNGRNIVVGDDSDVM